MDLDSSMQAMCWVTYTSEACPDAENSTIELKTSQTHPLSSATAVVQIGRYQQAGRVLDDNQPSSKLVRNIADHIIKAVEKQEGGGFQSHVSSFKWHV